MGESNVGTPTLDKIELLFVSNGHGEDLIAAGIAARLAGVARVAAMPLVGEGSHYSERGIPLAGPRQAMPSGGFILHNAEAFQRDWQAGWGVLLLRQIRFLWGTRPRLAVAVGDMGAFAAAWLTRSRVAFVGCNKSDYYRSWGSSYFAPEWMAMAIARAKVYPRDELTTTRLRARGVDAVYLGNPMMDGLDPGEPEPNSLALLPGSREDALENLRAMLEVLRHWPETEPVQLRLACPLEPHRLQAVVLEKGWHASEGGFRRGSCSLVLCSFQEALRSGAVLGLAGTANEQAVGLGRPVVSFPGAGTQYTPRFARLQAELLGPGLSLVTDGPDAVCSMLQRVLRDPSYSERARHAGRARMGEAGATERIARDLFDLLD